MNTHKSAIDPAAIESLEEIPSLIFNHVVKYGMERSLAVRRADVAAGPSGMIKRAE